MCDDESTLQTPHQLSVTECQHLLHEVSNDSMAQVTVSNEAAASHSVGMNYKSFQRFLFKLAGVRYQYCVSGPRFASDEEVQAVYRTVAALDMGYACAMATEKWTEGARVSP